MLGGVFNGKKLPPVEAVTFPVAEIIYSDNKTDYKSDKLPIISPVVYSNIKSLGPFRYEGGQMIYFCEANGQEVEICNFWFEIFEERIHVEEIVNEQNLVIVGILNKKKLLKSYLENSFLD